MIQIYLRNKANWTFTSRVIKVFLVKFKFHWNKVVG